MKKLSQRDLLCQRLQVSIKQAEHPTLAKIAALLASETPYPDERVNLLLMMADAGMRSTTYPDDQVQALTTRDAKYAAHAEGIGARKAVEDSAGRAAE